MSRALAATVALFCAIFAVVLVRYAPPSSSSGVGAGAEPQPQVPLDRFSVERARVVQRELADAGPRPTGSEGNARGRTILRGALERAGYAVEERASFACGRHGACGYVHDLVATRAGRDKSAAAVLLAAHHDSVTCSPGASDDGVGAAAVVEAARALGAAPPTQRPIVVLLTDGEEDGLLGAEAFGKDHPPVFAAVNVDARGGAGPSALFETSPGNAWLVALADRTLDRPVTSSLFFEVYKRMPNDTDFTVLKSFAHGVSLANIAHIEAYHTPLDTLANADPATLEHHGTQALALARALADQTDEGAAERGDSVWFDVLAFRIVRWPSSWSPALAALALALCLGQAVQLRAWGRGLVVFPASLAASAIVTFGLGAALRAGGAIPTPWIASPLPALISLHLATIAASVAVARRLGGSPRALWAGVWIAWGTVALAAAIVAPGASYLFTVPALIAGFAAMLPFAYACAVPAVCAAVLWLPLASPLYDAMGLSVPVLACVSSTVLVTTLAPMVDAAPPKGTLALAAAALALAFAAALTPPFTERRPQRVNVVFAQDASATSATSAAHVAVVASWGPVPWGSPPASMLRAGARTEVVLPWLAPGVVMDAPRLDLPPPEIVHGASSTEAGRRHVHATLRAGRRAGTHSLVLALPADRQVEVRVNGERAAPRGGTILALRGVPEGGVDVDLAFEGETPLDVTLYDATPGVPAGTPARPLYAAQTQDGDLTVLFVRDDL
jgi:hypothetical protein